MSELRLPHTGHLGLVPENVITIRTSSTGNSAKTLRITSLHFRDPANALIATPGVAKKLPPEGPLKHLWDHALKAIGEASAVVLVGYRFPPTDNSSKLKLQNALAGNGKKAPVHVVIGPANEHTNRVNGMLRWSLPVKSTSDPSRTVVHEMYAEDFFAVFTRQRLFNMHRYGT